MDRARSSHGPRRRLGGDALLVGLGAAAAASHVGYPVALGVLCALRGARAPVVSDPATWPALTVVIPAFREASTIAAKIDNIRDNGYEGELDVVVVSEDRETAEAARATGVKVIEPVDRLGKAQASNRGVQEAATPIVVLTDANNALVPGSLAALARHFEDPTVGAVAGEKTEHGETEAMYWRYESWLKDRESRLGTTIGIVGELFAVRTDAWRPIPVGVGSDDLWAALDLAERGYRVRYEPAARSEEPSAAGEEQWERRTRILSHGLLVFFRKRHLLHPGRGLIAFEILGHKVWRSTIGPLAHVALVVTAFATRRRSGLARAVLATHAAGAIAIAADARGAPLPRPLALLRQVLYLQVVALGGLGRAFRRDGLSPMWRKPRR